MHYLALFAGGTILSAVLTRYIRSFARNREWGCAPVRERDVHTCLMPRVGGIGIYLSVVVTLGVALLIAEASGALLHDWQFRMVWIVGCGTIVFLLGLIDDLRNLRPAAKFSVQILAGVLLYAGGLRISVIPLLFGAKVLSAFISLPLTILWVLLISNAFNLIDGLDGLSAGSALFSTIVVFVVAMFNGNALVSVLAAVLAGSLLGFLRYNFNPATIFLGDCGSLFVGFMLSALSIAGAQKGTTLLAVTIPLVSFGLPVIDTVLAVLRRFLSGKPLFSADRNHIHHRLLDMGFSHRQVVIILYGVSATLGLLSLMMLGDGGSSAGVVLVIVGLGIIFGVQHLGYHEFAELGRIARRTMSQKDIIANNLALRRGSEELSRAQDLQLICTILKNTFANSEFDAIDLKLHGAMQSFQEDPGPFERDFDGSWHFRYERDFSLSKSRSRDAVWTITLEMGIASLSLTRGSGSSASPIDVGVLTSEFQEALAEALARCAKPVPIPAVVTSRISETALEAVPS